MQTSEYLFLLLFMLIGALALLASIFNFDWFFTTRQAGMFVNRMGRTGARLFYGILGIILIACSIIGLVTFK